MLKQFLIFIFVVGLLIAGWIFVNSFDASNYDDKDLSLLIPDIPDSENAFLDLAYLSEDDFDFYEDDERGNVVEQLLYRNEKTFKAEKLETILAPKRHHYLVLVEALKKGSFQSPETGAEDMISVVGFLELNRHILLDSKKAAIEGDNLKAIELATLSIRFSQMFKNDKRAYLVTYWIGSAMERDSLSWLHQFISDYELSLDNYLALDNAFNYFSRFENDSFDAVFAGEFKWSQKYSHEIVGRDILLRISDYRLDEDYWNMNPDTWEYNRHVVDFFEALIPRYYLHPNRASEGVAHIYKSMVDSARVTCNKLEFVNNGAEMPPKTWLNLIKPNSLGERFKYVDINLSKYFERRCGTQFYQDAIHTILAIKKYELKNGSLPASIDLLVPEYISRIPIDYFTGDEVLFSDQNSWLYVRGMNFSDDGGSKDSRWQNSCFRQDHCKNNPTVSIKYDVSVFFDLEEVEEAGVSCDDFEE